MAKILLGEPMVFEGFLQGRGKGMLSIQLHPGLTIDVSESSAFAPFTATTTTGNYVSAATPRLETGP